MISYFNLSHFIYYFDVSNHTIQVWTCKFLFPLGCLRWFHICYEIAGSFREKASSPIGDPVILKNFKIDQLNGVWMGDRAEASGQSDKKILDSILTLNEEILIFNAYEETLT